MKNIVIDASVVLKLSSGQEETEVDLAKRLYSQIINGQVQAIAPRFILVEFVNIMIRKKGYSVKKTADLANDLAISGIDFRNLPLGIENVINIMEEYSLSAYDSLYILLAKQENCRLLTDDRKLLKLKDTLAVSLSEFFGVN